MEQKYDVAVIGGGIAGYSAALSAKSLGLDCLWLGETAFGEKVLKSEYVRNYPAFTGDGTRFYEALERQREKEGILFTQGHVQAVYQQKDGFIVACAEQMFSARTAILCTGVDLKGNVKGEREYLGRGVSYCAVCDGALYRGKKIAAVVTSPVFAEEVEYLAGFADTVYAFCLYEGATFRDPKIEVRRGAPRSIEGAGHVERIAAEGEALAVSGVFFLRSAIPPDSLVGGLKTDGAHIVVGRDLSTNLRGLFAAGDVTGLPYQYAKAAGEGLVAAHSVKKYLNGR